MASPRRRLSGWTVLSIVIGLLAAIAIVAWIWIESVASRRWGEMEKRIDELTEKSVSVDPARPAFSKPVIPGNAWEAYRRAADMLEVLGIDGNASGRYLSGDLKARDIASREVLVAQPALELVLQGARHGAAQYPHPWWVTSGANTPYPEYVNQLCLLMVAKARLEREAGSTVSAAKWIMVALVLARDQGHNGTYATVFYSGDQFALAFWELAKMLRSRKVTTESLNTLERDLEKLGDGFPQFDHELANTLVSVGGWVRNSESWVETVEPGPRWRDGFSERIAMAKAFDIYDQGFMRLGTAKSWAEEQDRRVEFITELHQSQCWTLPGVTGVPSSGRLRSHRAQLRLLRTAVAYLRSGERLALEDPFGGTLRIEETKRGIKVWSVGPNGTDEGGQGRFHDLNIPVNPPDIVLELPR